MNALLKAFGLPTNDPSARRRRKSASLFGAERKLNLHRHSILETLEMRTLLTAVYPHIVLQDPNVPAADFVSQPQNVSAGPISYLVEFTSSQNPGGTPVNVATLTGLTPGALYADLGFTVTQQETAPTAGAGPVLPAPGFALIPGTVTGTANGANLTGSLYSLIAAPSPTDAGGNLWQGTFDVASSQYDTGAGVVFQSAIAPPTVHFNDMPIKVNSITSPSIQTNNLPISYTVTFDRPVYDWFNSYWYATPPVLVPLNKYDFSVSATNPSTGAVPGFSVLGVTPSNNDETYTVTVGSTSGASLASAFVKLTVPALNSSTFAPSVVNAYGNTAFTLPATTATVEYDTTLTVDVERSATVLNNAQYQNTFFTSPLFANAVYFEATFNQAVLTFPATAVQLDDATTGAALPIAAASPGTPYPLGPSPSTVWEIPVNVTTTMTPVAISAKVLPNQVSPAGGFTSTNLNGLTSTANKDSINVSMKLPTPTITVASTGPYGSASTATVDVSFDEPVVIDPAGLPYTGSVTTGVGALTFSGTLSSGVAPAMTVKAVSPYSVEDDNPTVTFLPSSTVLCTRELVYTITGFEGTGTLTPVFGAYGAQDLYGNYNSDATAASSLSVQADSFSATVKSTDTPNGSGIITGPSVNFQVTFGQAVPTNGPNGFDMANPNVSTLANWLTTSNLTAGVLADSDVTITPVTNGATSSQFNVTIASAGTGQVTVAIPADMVQDSANNGNLASIPLSVNYQQPFTVSMILSNGWGNPVTGYSPVQAPESPTSPIYFMAEFSEPPVGFTGADVDLSHSDPVVGPVYVQSVTPYGTPVGTTNSLWLVTVAGMAHSGNVKASIDDGAVTDSNSVPVTMVGSAANVDYTGGPVGPTVLIAPQAGTPGSGKVDFTVSFSLNGSPDPVAGLSPDLIAFVEQGVGTIGTATTVTPQGTANPAGYYSTYTVEVTGLTSAGQYGIEVPANAALDVNQGGNIDSGNPYFIANYPDWANYTTAPTVAVSVVNGATVGLYGSQVVNAANQTAGSGYLPVGKTTDVPAVEFDVTFGSPVVNGTLPIADVTLAAGSAPGAAVVATGFVTGNEYYVDVAGMTGSGTVGISIPAGAILMNAAREPALQHGNGELRRDTVLDGNAPRVSSPRDFVGAHVPDHLQRTGGAGGQYQPQFPILR